MRILGGSGGDEVSSLAMRVMIVSAAIDGTDLPSFCVICCMCNACSALPKTMLICCVHMGVREVSLRRCPSVPQPGFNHCGHV